MWNVKEVFLCRHSLVWHFCTFRNGIIKGWREGTIETSWTGSTAHQTTTIKNCMCWIFHYVFFPFLDGGQIFSVSRKSRDHLCLCLWNNAECCIYAMAKWSLGGGSEGRLTTYVFYSVCSLIDLSPSTVWPTKCLWIICKVGRIPHLLFVHWMW